MPTDREIEAADDAYVDVYDHRRPGSHRRAIRAALEAAETVRLEDELEKFPIIPPKVRRGRQS